MTEKTQNADFRRKPQIFADSPLLLEIQAFEGRRKPQKTADFRRKPTIFEENRRKPQIGLCHLGCVTSGKKKAHKHKLFCPVGPSFHRTCPRDKLGLSLGVPGTNPVKNRDKPRNSPYSTHWKPDFTGFVPGTNPVKSQGQSRGRRAAQKVYVKKVYVPFSLANICCAILSFFGLLSCFGLLLAQLL